MDACTRKPNRGKALKLKFDRASKSGGRYMRHIMKEFTRVLPADAIELISKHRLQCYNGTITPTELVQRMKLITGKELFQKAIIASLEKHGEPKDSKFVDKLISQFSCQLKIKPTDKQ